MELLSRCPTHYKEIEFKQQNNEAYHSQTTPAPADSFEKFALNPKEIQGFPG